MTSESQFKCQWFTIRQDRCFLGLSMNLGIGQKRFIDVRAGKNMNKKVYEFEATIHKVSDVDGAYVEFPYNVKAEFGKGRVKVHATFDGEPYDGSVVNMGVKNEDGSVCYIIGIRKDIRSKIDKQAGDVIKVIVKERD